MCPKKIFQLSSSFVRLLTEEEKDLLKSLQKTIYPLKKNRVEFESLSFPISSSPRPLSPKPLQEISSPTLIPSKSLQKSSIEKGLLPLEKHTARKIKSKQYTFAATLDLHGLSQSDAYERLVSFIKNNAQQNKRSLLIITGKGHGILKKSLFSWLQSPLLRPFILSVEQSMPYHGGEGAYYVLLKKQEKLL